MEDHVEVIIRSNQTGIVKKRFRMKLSSGINRIKQSAGFHMSIGTTCDLMHDGNLIGKLIR